MEATAEIRFGPWALRKGPLELRRAGQRVPLQDQPLQVLDELLATPGELVTRERLIARLWPKRIVDYDTALNATVRRLRAALGDEAETPRYIETIPRHGYRFIGAVTPVTADSPTLPGASDRDKPEQRASGSRRRDWRWPAIFVMLFLSATALWFLAYRPAGPGTGADRSPPAVATNSIAVLPFLDLSPEQNQQYLADGLAEDILTLLAQTPGLRVSARTSSFIFRDADADIGAIAARLNVTHVLEGSVRRAGQQVRVTAQLIEAGTNSHAWSATYDRPLNDLFELQTEIAASIANTLRHKLGSEPQSGGTRNALAYEKYLLGQHYYRRRAAGDTERARQYYLQALDIDPEFARAWSGLANAYWILTVDGTLTREVGLEKLRHAAERALALDPGLADPHIRLNHYYRATDEHAAASKHLRSAAALEPNNPLVLSFNVSDAIESGRVEQALDWQRRIVAVDPISVVPRRNLAEMLLIAGQLDEAIAEAARVRELDPTRHVATGALAMILARRYEQALEEVQGWPQGQDRSQCLALIYYARGEEAKATAALERLIEQAGTSEPVRIAEVYAFRGENDQAFRWLEIAAEQAQGRPFAWVRESPFLAPLSTDPRWPAAVGLEAILQ